MEDTRYVNPNNFIEDDNNYYFFRALEPGDMKDIQEGVIQREGNSFNKLRTDRERFEERNAGKLIARYPEGSSVSLEEMYHHIKYGYSLDTNCISLSTNAGIAVTYGGEFRQYVMVKVPKNKESQNINAASYMMEELKKRVEARVEKLQEEAKKGDTASIRAIVRLEELENAKDSARIREVAIDSFVLGRKYAGKEYRSLGQSTNKESIGARFGRIESIKEEEQLELDKLFAQITILEASGKGSGLVEGLTTNESMIKTVKSAISSKEVIHYGDVDGNEMVSISQSMVDIFSLLQQEAEQIEHIPVDKQPARKKAYELLKREILNYALQGYDIQSRRGHITIENGEKVIDVMGVESENSTILHQNEYVSSIDKGETLTIEDAYHLVDGNASYDKISKLFQSVYYLSKGKSKVAELSKVLRAIVQENSELANSEEVKEILEEIYNEAITVETEIVNRKNNRGQAISESLRIDVNDTRKLINEEELSRVIEQVGEESEEARRKILSGDSEEVYKIVANILADAEIEKEEKSKERFYIEALFDSYDFQSIGAKFTDLQKTEFITKMEEEKVDIEAVYKKLRKIGLTDKEIATSVINAYITGKIKEIAEAKELTLEEITSIQEREISTEKIETYLGYYNVEGTSMTLKGYQETASRSIDRAFLKKRFASVILPTGSGKSFVAMAEMLKEQYHLKDKEGKKILYLAPSKEILDQIETNLLKYASKKNAEAGLDKDQMIKKYFPKLELATYASLMKYKDGKQKPEEYSLIVLDELHRTGAEEWQKGLEKVIEAQGNDTKVLGITATPRRDSDGRDMADEIALKLGYTAEEVLEKKHKVYEMTLEEAIRQRLVVNPKVVKCLYYLKESGELDLLQEEINEEPDEEKRKQAQAKLENIRKRIDEAEGIEEIFNNYLKPGGKYLLFIPKTDKDIEEDVIDEEDIEETDIKDIDKKIKKAQKEMESQLKLLREQGYKIEFVTMHSGLSDKKNLANLREFESSVPSDTIRIMIAIDKFNEGIHISGGLDGMIWKRYLDENSKTLFLQQLGRVIYSIDDDYDENKAPIVIDAASNTNRIKIEQDYEKVTPKDDLVGLREAISWMQVHDMKIPDINSKNREEATKAAVLKKIQEKYVEYIQEEEKKKALSEPQKDKQKEEERIKKQEIIKLANSIGLFSIEFPEKIRTEREPNKGFKDNTSITVEGILKDLYELEDEVYTRGNVVQRLEKFINELETWCQENNVQSDGTLKLDRHLPRNIQRKDRTSEEKEENNLAQKMQRFKRGDIGGSLYKQYTEHPESLTEKEKALCDSEEVQALFKRYEHILETYEQDTRISAMYGYVNELETWCQKNNFQSDGTLKADRHLPRVIQRKDKTIAEQLENSLAKKIQNFKIGGTGGDLYKQYKEHPESLTEEERALCVSEEVQTLFRRYESVLETYEQDARVSAMYDYVNKLEKWCKKNNFQPDGTLKVDRHLPRQIQRDDKTIEEQEENNMAKKMSRFKNGQTGGALYKEYTEHPENLTEKEKVLCDSEEVQALFKRYEHILAIYEQDARISAMYGFVNELEMWCKKNNFQPDGTLKVNRHLPMRNNKKDKMVEEQEEESLAQKIADFKRGQTGRALYKQYKEQPESLTEEERALCAREEVQELFRRYEHILETYEQDDRISAMYSYVNELETWCQENNFQPDGTLKVDRHLPRKIQRNDKTIEEQKECNMAQKMNYFKRRWNWRGFI